MSITSRLNEGNKTVSRPVEGDKVGFQLANLKTRLANTERENERLRDQLSTKSANQRTMVIDDSGVHLQSQVKIDGVVFQNLQHLKGSEDFKSLVTLLKPLVQLTNSLIRGNDVLKRKPTMKKDAENKITSEPLKDAEGKVIMMPSISDRMQKTYESMLSDPVIKDLLNQINKRYDELNPVYSKETQIKRPSPKG